MVRVRDDLGGYFHEPPYTWEEEQELYQRMAGGNGPITVVRGPRPAASEPCPGSPSPVPAK
jgi:hypothetical protein